jgi:hypothetical protein
MTDEFKIPAALTPKKRVGPRIDLDVLEKKNILVPALVSEPQAGHYIDWATPPT